MVAAAGEPHHDRQRALRPLARAPNVDVKAIFLTPDLLTHELRAHGSIAAAITYTLPGCRRLRWLPPQLPDWRLGVRDAFERERLPFDGPANCTLLCADNVSSWRATPPLLGNCDARQQRQCESCCSRYAENGVSVHRTPPLDFPCVTKAASISASIPGFTVRVWRPSLRG